MEALFVAERCFDATAGERWNRYIAWSGLSQLSEVVSLDAVLCPTVPEELIAADWEYNVHADYKTSYFRALEYLRDRVASEASHPHPLMAVDGTEGGAGLPSHTQLMGNPRDG